MAAHEKQTFSFTPDELRRQGASAEAKAIDVVLVMTPATHKSLVIVPEQPRDEDYEPALRALVFATQMRVDVHALIALARRPDGALSIIDFDVHPTQLLMNCRIGVDVA